MEENTQNKKEELSPFANLISQLIGGIIGLAFLYLAFLWFQNKSEEREFLTTMYDHAKEEVAEHCTGSNLEFAKFKNDYIAFQTYEYHDFGNGELRYAKYAVKVPIEYDSTFGHREQNVTIKVYYYTSNQNISEGIDISVVDHFFIEDMFAGLFDW